MKPLIDLDRNVKNNISYKKGVKVKVYGQTPDTYSDNKCGAISV